MAAEIEHDHHDAIGRHAAQHLHHERQRARLQPPQRQAARNEKAASEARGNQTRHGGARRPARITANRISRPSAAT